MPDEILGGIPPWDELPLDPLSVLPETDRVRTAERYEATRRMLLAFSLEDDLEVSEDAVQAANGSSNSLRGSVTELRGPSQNRTPTDAATRFVQNVDSNWRTVASRVRPFLRGSITDWAAEAAEAKEAKERFGEVTTRWAELQAEAERIIERVGVGRLAGHYENEAKGHGTSAGGWLGGVIAATVALTALVTWLVVEAYLAPSGADWRMVATQAAAKAVGIGVLSYVVTFCSRNYRVHKHLQASYRQRMAALDTYAAMATALADNQDDKRIVLTELAKAIFAAGDTGFMASGSGDKTIIEQSIPLTSMLNGGAGRA